MNNKEIESKINEMVIAVGAMAEYMGLMRKSLMDNGFTREEAVAMCLSLMISMTTGNNKEGKE